MSVVQAQAIVNGQTINLSYNSTSGKWEGTATAPSTSSYGQSGHYYPVTLKAWDDAGNLTVVDATDSSLGEALKLIVKETVAPTISVTSPTTGSYIISNKPTITWTVMDNDSGVDPSTISIKIDSGSAITGNSIQKTSISGGYTCSYTPSSALSDGSHTVKFNASDNDGNAATQASTTFTVDTVPPTLSISSPEDNAIVNTASITVSGTTNDVTSSPVTVTVKLNSAAAEAVTVGSGGTFSKVLTLSSGLNTIVITATDSAGKSSTVTRSVTLDTAAPVFSNIVITPNPATTGTTYTISVTITDD